MSQEVSSAPAPALRAVPFLTGLGLVTAGTLSLEVLDTRLLSVITWYSLAFLVIAMGLFGLTAGALHVYLTPADFEPTTLVSSLSRSARRFALAIPLSLVLLLCVPLTTAPVFTTVALFVVFSCAIALPFYPAGIVVAAALTRTRFPIGRVYAVDLIGAALGAPVVPVVLRHFGGETSILMVGVVAAFASVSFAVSGNDQKEKRSGLRVLAITAGLALANAVTPHGLQPIWVKGRLDNQDFALEIWNSHSRIRVWEPSVIQALVWGKGSRCELPSLKQHVIEIDAAAGTALYESPDGVAGLDFLSCDVTNAAAMTRQGGRAAIIGVGGSRDLQAALLTHHSPVYGVEFNDRMLEMLKGPIGRLSGVPSNPSVRLVESEGRSFMARTEQKFQMIQASLVDTWAATGAGAHALGENSLYTIEAWRTFMDRLEPDGVFTISRWTQETERVASLAMGTLLDAKIPNPRQHVVLIGTPVVVTLILAKSPFSTGDIHRLRSLADQEGFNLLAPDSEIEGAVGDVLRAKSRAELDRVTFSKNFDYRPPTDDRPYFFNVLPLEAAWRDLPMQPGMGAIEGNRLATRTLVLSFLVSVLLVTWAILVPLLRRARPGGAVDRSLGASIAYFTLIGVAFMITEMTLLQRLGLILGHPSYSLVVVITSLVGATGLGALASDRLPLARAPFCYVYPLVIAAALVGLALVWPKIAPAIISDTTPVRILFAVAITSLLGVLMGVAFPVGIRLTQVAHPNETPWFWGMNGIGSVLASSLAVMIAQRYGLSVALLVAAACYALLVVPVAFIVGKAT